MAEQDLTEQEAETVEVVAEVHAQHRRKATLLDRGADAVTSGLGRSTTVTGMLVVVLAWMAYNHWGSMLGPAFDPPPFVALELIATILALLLAALILATQRREDRLAEQRAQLTLQAAVLNDRKIAKVISLLEELRRDLPSVRDRDDDESTAMAKTSDPNSLLDAIEVRTPGHGTEV